MSHFKEDFGRRGRVISCTLGVWQELGATPRTPAVLQQGQEKRARVKGEYTALAKCIYDFFLDPPAYEKEVEHSEVPARRFRRLVYVRRHVLS